MKLIPLTKGYQAMVDDEDYERVMQYKWHLQMAKGDKPYAHRAGPIKNGKQPTICLHRFIMNAVSGVEIDHTDGNGLNCQKYNLRTCTHAQNTQNKGLMSTNRSGVKGVHWSEPDKKWLARIMVEGRKISLGSYRNIEDAAKAYREAAVKYHGEFANFGDKK